MFKTNQDIIGEQCIRNDDVLTVSKLLYKLLNTEFAWNKNCLSQTDTVSSVPYLIDNDFPTRIPDCDSHRPALLDLFLSSDATILDKKGWRQIHVIKQNRFFYGMFYTWLFAIFYLKISTFGFWVDGWVLAPPNPSISGIFLKFPKFLKFFGNSYIHFLVIII